MKEIEIKKYYKKKINELKKHNKSYFEESAPKISDKNYDQIKKEILDLEKNYNFLKSSLSPSKSLGLTPSKNFIKSKHRVKNVIFIKRF